MFNLKIYKTLIKKLLNAGLKPSTNWNKKLSKNTLFIRHDIDFSIEYAYRLALSESRLKICSSYFFMMTSNFYNLLSSHNQKLVKKISSMGHKVSIHFDPTAYKDLKYFKYEKNVFENIFGKKIDIVSIHRPRFFLKNNNIKLSGISQTYQDVFFKKKYSEKTILNRMSELGEYNNYIDFFGSELNSYTSGSCFVIDGGATSIL